MSWPFSFNFQSSDDVGEFTWRVVEHTYASVRTPIAYFSVFAPLLSWFFLYLFLVCPVTSFVFYYSFSVVIFRLFFLVRSLFLVAISLPTTPLLSVIHRHNVPSVSSLFIVFIRYFSARGSSVKRIFNIIIIIWQVGTFHIMIIRKDRHTFLQKIKGERTFNEGDFLILKIREISYRGNRSLFPYNLILCSLIGCSTSLKHAR